MQAFAGSRRGIDRSAPARLGIDVEGVVADGGNRNCPTPGACHQCSPCPNSGQPSDCGTRFRHHRHQRAGTTSLHAYLSAHSQVITPATKELHFFTDRYECVSTGTSDSFRRPPAGRDHWRSDALRTLPPDCASRRLLAMARPQNRSCRCATRSSGHTRISFWSDHAARRRGFHCCTCRTRVAGWRRVPPREGSRVCESSGQARQLSQGEYVRQL